MALAFRPSTALALLLLLFVASCELVIDVNDENGDVGDDDDITEPDPRPDPRPNPTFERPADCESDCCDACSFVGECSGSQTRFESCSTLCSESRYVEVQQIECLALRIYWINEEGCDSILETFESFDLSDDCAE